MLIFNASSCIDRVRYDDTRWAFGGIVDACRFMGSVLPISCAAISLPPLVEIAFEVSNAQVG
jgi:hypothetical protein